MRRLKTLTMIVMLALAMSLGTPKAFAGFMPTGITAADGTAESPGVAGDMHTPSATGEMGSPGFSDGWIGTGIAALVSLFG